MVLTPAARHLGRQVSPLISLHLPNVPPPTTPCNPSIALHAISAYRVDFRLRHRRAGSSSHTAESSSLYCGPSVRLQLLSTPPRGDAVTFSYRALAYPDTDFHRANVAPSGAHSPRCAGPHRACFKKIHKVQRRRRKRLPQTGAIPASCSRASLGGHNGQLHAIYTVGFNPVSLYDD